MSTSKAVDSWFRLALAGVVGMILCAGAGVSDAAPAATVMAGAGGAAESRPAESGKILLTFPDNVDLKTVVDYVAARLGKNILYDGALAARTLTIRSPVPVNQEELMAILRSVLRFRQLALVEAEQEGWLKIVTAEKIGETTPLELVRPGRPDDLNSVVVRLVKLEHTAAGPFVEIAKVLLSKPGGNMLPLPDGQTLVLTDYKNVVDALVRIKTYIDVPHLKRHWKIDKAKHVLVTRVSSELKVLIDHIIRKGTVAETEKSLQPAVPIPGINAFLLSGTGEQISQMESLIDMLDVPSVLATEIYRLKHTGAQRGAALLNQMLLPVQQTARGAGKWSITADTEANALVVTCPKGRHGQLKRWIEEQIDIPSDVTIAGLRTRVFQVRFARAAELAGTIQSVFAPSAEGRPIGLDLNVGGRGGEKRPAGTSVNPDAKTPSSTTRPYVFKPKAGGDEARPDGFSLTVHAATNTIIATGTSLVLSHVETLIKRLDRHRPQVLIDATIVSVSESRASDLGIELHHLHVDDKTNQLDYGVLSAFGLLDVDPVSAGTTAKFGAGFNAVILRPGEMSAIIRAFRSRLDGRVVARPQLLIDDNATGHLSSVNEQPFTSVNAGETVSTTSFAGYAEAGTQVSFTPHISEGDVVSLSYSIASSSFTGASADANIPPPRAKDSVQSQVTIPHGYVLLVGGLTRENHQKSRSEVPLLADIPILGELFGIRSNSSSRSILYVFLRPRIIREDRFAYLRFVSKEALVKAGVPSEIPPMKMELLK